jgi:hypothetical protein
MNKKTLRNSAAILCALGAIALSGCAAADDLINRQVTHTHDNKDGFVADASVDAEWIPGDATEITVRTPADNDGDVAVILLVSTSELPATCRDAERQSQPMLNIAGAPEIYEPKNSTIQVCDDWTVMKSETGWFGWTPNKEDQAEAVQQ